MGGEGGVGVGVGGEVEQVGGFAGTGASGVLGGAAIQVTLAPLSREKLNCLVFFALQRSTRKSKCLRVSPGGEALKYFDWPGQIDKSITHSKFSY